MRTGILNLCWTELACKHRISSVFQKKMGMFELLEIYCPSSAVGSIFVFIWGEGREGQPWFSPRVRFLKFKPLDGLKSQLRKVVIYRRKKYY